MRQTALVLLLSLGAVVLLRSGSVTASHSGEAQVTANPSPTPSYPIATLRRDFKNSLPLTAGEKLEYEVRLARFPIYATVGTVTFEYLGAVTDKAVEENQSSVNQTEPSIKGLNVPFNLAADDSLLHLRATVASKGMLVALLGMDVKHRYETFVDANTFSARLNFTEVKEGKKHTAQSAVYDRASQQVKYLTDDLTKPDAAPRAKFLPLKDGMMSLLSAFYFARLQKFKEGQMISFPVSSDEENYQFDIIVGKREKLKTDCGKIKTIKLDPKLFGPGQFISRQGEMTIWVTDDNKHIPLQITAKANSGTLNIKLTNFKNNCKILDSETEMTQKN